MCVAKLGFGLERLKKTHGHNIMRRFAVIIFALLLGGMTQAQSQKDINALVSAMEQVRAEDWENLILPRDPLARAIVDWHRLRASQGELPEYVQFLEKYPDWPGLPQLRVRGEPSITAETPPGDVIAYFAKRGPRTANGALRLGAALIRAGEKQKGEAEIIRGWTSYSMSEELEAEYLQGYGKLLRRHHDDRLDMLNWSGLDAESRRLYPLVDADTRALSDARLGLRKSVKGVDSLIAAVPADLRGSPGLAYERFVWRMRKGFANSAAELILERSEAKTLGVPARWASRRRDLARRLMREGESTLAYRVASTHGLSEGSNYADLEWLSGYIALKKRNRPGEALRHFTNHKNATKSAISQGRALYWQAIALDEMGEKSRAREAFAAAAVHQTSFYGQLAAERIGAPTNPAILGKARFPGWSEAPFARSTVLRSALLLFAAGETALGRRWFVHLSEALTPDELGQLADLAFDIQQPNVALMVAKYGARNGIILDNAYFPITPLARQKLSSPAALNLAIARRESEFDPTVVSPAGARGLMQLMPGTAEEMARKTGQTYSAGKLLSDPEYNASLGSAYLGGLIEEFDGNIPLIAAAYNAGPSRARRWIRDFGDPRSRRVDAVDWIEHIPFNETRNYVMRVVESYEIYERRLSGRATNFRTGKLLKD